MFYGNCRRLTNRHTVPAATEEVAEPGGNVHADRVARHLVAAALVAGLATVSLSVISTQAVGASTGSETANVQRFIANVNDCLHGGYVNYSTSSGKTFGNELGCVIYALFGGTLVPLLPDFVYLIVHQRRRVRNVQSSFSVENLGASPGTGNLVLDATLTSPQPLTGGPVSSASADCQPSQTAQNVANANVDGNAGTETATASCTTTFPPGATPIPLTVGVDSGSASGQSVTITATVNPGHTMAESNYANDSFSETFVVS